MHCKKDKQRETLFIEISAWTFIFGIALIIYKSML
jgi:hypothetical protein